MHDINTRKHLVNLLGPMPPTPEQTPARLLAPEAERGG